MEKVTIVKVGGAIVEDNEQLVQLLTDFAAIPGKKVLVHGGGRRATKVAAALGIESKMVNGRRITDAQMLEVVTMVYGGLVNKNLVAKLQAKGVNALGLTGADMDDTQPQTPRQGRSRLRICRRCGTRQWQDAANPYPGRHYTRYGSVDSRWQWQYSEY